MGGALMKGAAGYVGAGSITLYDTAPSKAASLAEEISARAAMDMLDAIRDADFVFMAVKPNVMESALHDFGKVLKERPAKAKLPVLVSMAAGWNIHRLQELLPWGGALGTRYPVIRIMPNTPALVGKGAIAMKASPEVSSDDASAAEQILQACGLVVKIEEYMFDAVTGLSGSGPAYAFMFIEALADGGVRAGLPRAVALQLAAKTLEGAGVMALETGKHPGELKDMVCSPGGTTIEAVAALEAAGLRSAVIAAVAASANKSAAMTAS
jgi:pyrroline-5-carboxylate reductase